MFRRIVVLSIGTVLAASGCIPLDCKSPESVEAYTWRMRTAGTFTMAAIQSRLTEPDKVLLRKTLENVKSILLADEKQIGAITDVINKAMESLRFHNETAKDLLAASVLAVIDCARPRTTDGETSDFTCGVRLVAAALEGAIAVLPQPAPTVADNHEGPPEPRILP